MKSAAERAGAGSNVNNVFPLFGDPRASVTVIYVFSRRGGEGEEEEEGAGGPGHRNIQNQCGGECGGSETEQYFTCRNGPPRLGSRWGGVGVGGTSSAKRRGCELRLNTSANLKWKVDNPRARQTSRLCRPV